MADLSINASTVKPLSDRILVKVQAAEEKTAGGIFLPEMAKEKPQVGEVVSVGAGKFNDNGTRNSIDVEVGASVLYSKYAGTDLKIGNDDYVLLREQDILAIVS